MKPEETFPKGWIDWNKLSLQEHIDHLKGRFAYSSEGTAKSVFELIAAYETLKAEKGVQKEALTEQRFTIEDMERGCIDFLNFWMDKKNPNLKQLFQEWIKTHKRK